MDEIAKEYDVVVLGTGKFIISKSHHHHYYNPFPSLQEYTIYNTIYTKYTITALPV